MDLGHAVERALAELRKLGRQVLAAEDPLLAQRLVDRGDGLSGAVEVDDEFLEEIVGKGMRTPGILPRQRRREMRLRCRIVSPTSRKPCGPSSAI